MHRCYVPHATDGAIELEADQAHHIISVLRLGPGAMLVVFDGRGHEWAGRIESASRSRVVIAVGQPRVPLAEPPVALTLAVGLLKGDQMSDVVRNATVLGVRRIVPFVSQHTAMARPSAWADLRQRWQRIAVAATAQSGRAVVPDVSEVLAFEELIQGTSGYLLVCVEPTGQPAAVEVGDRPPEATLLVGPEGGWAAAEVDRAVRHGARLLTLGPRTLRAELTPIVALSLLWTRWGWE